MQRSIAVLQLLGDVQLARHAAWTTACDLQALKRAVEAIIRDHAHKKELSSLSVFVVLHFPNYLCAAPAVTLHTGCFLQTPGELGGCNTETKC
jgi:hypothetical protein